MQKNFDTVVSVLNLRFPDLAVYGDDYGLQCGTAESSVPAVSDMRGILKCFFDNWMSIFEVDNSWGVITVYLDDGIWNDKPVNIAELSMFLPFHKLDDLKALAS